jgi:hypothetical protein
MFCCAVMHHIVSNPSIVKPVSTSTQFGSRKDPTQQRKHPPTKRQEQQIAFCRKLPGEALPLEIMYGIRKGNHTTGRVLDGCQYPW